MSIALDKVLGSATHDFLDNLKKGSSGPYPFPKTAQDLYECVVISIEAANITLPKSQRLSVPRQLPNISVAIAIVELEQVICIPCGERDEKSD